MKLKITSNAGLNVYWNSRLKVLLTKLLLAGYTESQVVTLFAPKYKTASATSKVKVPIRTLKPDYDGVILIYGLGLGYEYRAFVVPSETIESSRGKKRDARMTVNINKSATGYKLSSVPVRFKEISI